LELKPGSSFLIEHDLFRKPVATFRNHAPDGAGFASAAAAADQRQEHAMPNRGELPIPATRERNSAKSRTAGPDADAWTIIAFCAIGGLLSFCLAISSIGVNGYPAMMMQMPWGG
jgi:hypothetical protein